MALSPQNFLLPISPPPLKKVYPIFSLLVVCFRQTDTMEIQRHNTMVYLLLILGFLTTLAQSVRFDLQSGHTKCISDDIKSNSMTVGKYSVVNPNDAHPMPESHKLTVRVKLKKKRSKTSCVFFESLNAYSISFSFLGVFV